MVFFFHKIKSYLLFFIKILSFILNINLRRQKDDGIWLDYVGVEAAVLVDCGLEIFN